MTRARKLAIVLAAVAAVTLFVGSQIERFLNRVDPVPLPVVSPEARRLHLTSVVVDLHADSLMHGRDLLIRSDVGHVDLPRLQEGGVAIQFFTAATVAPLGTNMERTRGDMPDMVTIGALVQASPVAFQSPLERALWQAEQLDVFASRSGGRLVPIRTRDDLENLIARRREDPTLVGAVLGIEGAHALDDDLANFDAVFAAGYRMIGFAHFFDNAFSGSAHGVEKGGLSELGRALLRRMEASGVLVDLSHASPRAVDDALAIATKPTVFSHGGVKGVCDNTRNLSDAQVRAIAAGGGVVGIGYWDWAVCGIEVSDVVAGIRHVVTLVGDDHVGLGSDYDGGTTVGFDTSRLPALTQGLLDAGLRPESIRKILGGNAVRVLRETLP